MFIAMYRIESKQRKDEIFTICDDFFVFVLIVLNSFRNSYKIVARRWLFLPFFSFLRGLVREEMQPSVSTIPWK